MHSVRFSAFGVHLLVSVTLIRQYAVYERVCVAFPSVPGLWDKHQQLIPRLRFFFFFLSFLFFFFFWSEDQLARTNSTLFRAKDQSTVAQRAQTTEGERSLTSYV